jgi:dienelactone hydrolase
MARRAFVVAFATLASCGLDLHAPPDVVHVRFDPTAQVIPMPNDMVRDSQKGLLALPISDDLSPAEKELRAWLNEQDGFPTTFAATVSFDAPVEPTTIDADSLQVWRWGDTPAQLASTDVARALDRDGTSLTMQPPELGWERGRTYAIVMRGGSAGIRGANRQRVIADAAFAFLRSTQKLDDPVHERAFPGATRAERMANAQLLEAQRVRLQPYFDFFAGRGLGRDDIAAMWTFTVTSRAELAMDAPSQRMPVPFDLLLDPNTGRIAIPPHAGDSPVESEGKQRLADYDGWGLSANLMFESTQPLAATLPPGAVELWEIGDKPKQLAITMHTFSDRQHVEVVPTDLPLKEASTYGLVVRDSMVADDGRALAPMTIGHFMRAHNAVAVAGKSQIGAVGDDDATRVELARARIAPLLDAIGRDHVVTAWPLTTQRVVPHINDAIARAKMAVPPAQPENLKHLTSLEALSDFLLAISSLVNVSDVYYGSLKLPTWLDPQTHAWRSDGQYAMRDVQFAMTVPRNAQKPLPVVIFGHAIVTERRFVLAVGDALAQRGFAAISIDFPYHGEQTICTDEALLAVPDPQTGKIQHLPPCDNGYTCVDGKCVDASGQGNHLARFPVLNFPVASGAAFIEIDHIANTRDHFLQAVLDLTALERSLKEANWTGAGGITFDPNNVYYAGQSLGGIIGATYVSHAPGLKRMVLNVPGANLVDLFRDSPYFSGQVTAFFTRQQMDPASWQAARFLNLARLIVDAVDPQSVVQQLQGRPVMVQMATLDAIIPNSATKTLVRIANVPERDYVAEHAFLVIPVEPAYAPGCADLADFLAGTLHP